MSSPPMRPPAAPRDELALAEADLEAAERAADRYDVAEVRAYMERPGARLSGKLAQVAALYWERRHSAARVAAELGITEERVRDLVKVVRERIHAADGAGASTATQAPEAPLAAGSAPPVGDRIRARLERERRIRERWDRKHVMAYVEDHSTTMGKRLLEVAILYWGHKVSGGQIALKLGLKKDRVWELIKEMRALVHPRRTSGER